MDMIGHVGYESYDVVEKAYFQWCACASAEKLEKVEEKVDDDDDDDERENRNIVSDDVPYGARGCKAV